MIITMSDDFDPRKIADSGQCFRWELCGHGEYRIVHRDHALYMSTLEHGRYEMDCNEAEYESVWRPYFDLETSYAAIRERIDPEKDAFLAKAAEAGRGIRILRQDSWEILISFIISQNRNIPLIMKSVRELCHAAGEKRLDRRNEPYYTFPGADRIAGLSEEVLTGACALGYRWRYVQTVSRMAARGELDLAGVDALDDPTALKTLMALYGVGKKVASCVMLFGFHRLNIFPVDVWMRRVIENEYPNGYDEAQYQPYNGVYQQYMFAYYRQRQGKDDTTESV